MRISNPGLYTTVQDLGRYGYQSIGIPTSGAMDEYSLRIANLLVSNEESCACLEFTITGPTVIFEEKTSFALACDADAFLNEERVEGWRSYIAYPEDVLRVGRMKRGCRGYLSFAGGINSPVILGSRSCCAVAKIGKPLRAGDELTTNSAERPEKKLETRFIPQWKNDVRVLLGPQDDHFTERGMNTFLGSEYKVTDNADRMGYRLEGNRIEHREGKREIISDGNPLGAVQVPGDGEPIVLMKDRQTTGGYPKIATVITPDVSDVAQMKPGSTLRFEAVTLEKAYSILAEDKKRLDEIKASFSPPVSKPIKRYKMIINGKEHQIEVEEL
jgi:biotin-dependent carboxylase-like uncharacterized protein